MWKATPRRLAVQIVAAASATLSAAYYASQAPAAPFTVLDVTIAPWVVFFAVTAFALDLAKPQMMQIAGTAGLGVARRTLAAVVFAVLFVASMIAVDGMLMRMRSDWAAERGNTIAAHREAVAEIKRLSAEMGALGTPRPVAVIQAEVQALKIDLGVWRRSAQCSDISRDDTRAACEPVLALYKERGAAARKAEIEPQIAAARAKLERLDAPKSADPQAEALARLMGQDEPLVAYGMVALIGLAVELVACFGMWLLQRPDPPPVPDASALPPPAASAAPSAHGTDPVVEWVRAYRARHGRDPQIPQVQEQFRDMRLPKTTAWRRIKSA